MNEIDLFSTLLSKDNITLALSIFGAVGTLIAFISSYIAKRKNLKIYITDAAYRKDTRVLLISVVFENRSTLPISVTFLKCFLGVHELSLLEYPICVRDYTHHRGKDVIDRKFFYNLRMPVDIQQLSAVSGYIALELSQKELEMLPIPLTLQVRSTRKGVQKIVLQPNQIRGL